MMKYYYRFKLWLELTFNPRALGCPMEPVYTFFKRAHQFLTPWLGVKRKLMEQVRINYGKLLSDGLSMVYQRTRDGSNIYYLLTTYFGRVKFYRIDFIDKKTRKNTNIFLSGVIPALCGEDNTNNIEQKKVCLYKGWCFTKKQALKALKAIRDNSKKLNWYAPMCDEVSSYTWAKSALDYLNGKHVYFICPEDTELEKEMHFREEVFLIMRDIENRNKYVSDIQGIVYKALEEISEERNKELKKRLKDLLKKFEKAGYKKFWLKYYV